MGVYLQQKDKLLRLSGENITDEKVINALGYVPADENAVKNHIKDKDVHVSAEDRENWDNKDYASLENKPNIEDDGSDSFNVADDNGHIIFKADAAGIYSTDLFLNKNSKGVNEIITSNEENIAKANENITNLKNNFDEHIEEFESSIGNINNQLQYIDTNEDDSFKIVDSNGRIGLLVDDNGVSVATMQAEQILVQNENIIDKIESNKNKISSLNQKIINHIDDFDEHIEEFENSIGNINNQLQYIDTNEDDSFKIVDSNGRIGLLVDDNGLSATTIQAKNIILNDENVADKIQSNTNKINNLNQSVVNHINDFDEHIINEFIPVDERTKNLDGNQLVNLLSVVDNDGYIIATIDKDGFHTTNLFVKPSSYAEEEDINLKINEHIEAFEEYKETAAEQITTDKLNVNEIESTSIVTNDLSANQVNINNLNVAEDIILNGEFKNNDSMFSITDSNGYIVTQVDSRGLNTIALLLNGENILDIVDDKIANLVDSSPETLNTLNELAAALGDDPNFATTISTQIGSLESKKLDKTTFDDHVNGVFTTLSKDFEEHQQEFSEYQTAVDNRFTNLINNAPEDLNTLGKLATVITDHVEDFEEYKGNLSELVDTTKLKSNEIETVFIESDHIVTNRVDIANNLNVTGDISLNGDLKHNDSVFNITDLNGNIIMQVDENGLNTIALMLDGEDVLEIVDDKIAVVVDNSPETLNTLRKIATAINNDPNFTTTISTQINNLQNNKLDKSVFESEKQALINNAPSDLDSFGEVAAALNNDAQFATTVSNDFKAVNDKIDTHIEDVFNPFKEAYDTHIEDAFNPFKEAYDTHIEDEFDPLKQAFDSHVDKYNTEIPILQEKTEHIETTDNKSFVITDGTEDSNIILKVDEKGLETTDINAKTISLNKQDITESFESKIINSSESITANRLTAENININNDLTINGTTTLGGDITTTGILTASELNVNGNTLIGGELSVGEKVSSKTFLVEEDITIGSDKKIIITDGNIETITINANEITTADINVSNNLSVDETITGKDIVASNSLIIGDDTTKTFITKEKITTAKIQATSIDVSADLTTNKADIITDVAVGGEVTVTGNVSANNAIVTNDLTVGNNAEISGDMVVTGDVSADNINIEDTLNVNKIKHNEKFFNITDDFDNVLATFDEKGLNTVDLLIKGESYVDKLNQHIEEFNTHQTNLGESITTGNALVKDTLTVGENKEVSISDGNIIAVANKAGVITANNITVNDDLSVGANLTVLEKITATGNIISNENIEGKNIKATNGSIEASGEIKGASIVSTGNISGVNITGSGTVSGNSLSSSTNISLNGTITGATNITASGKLSINNIEASGDLLVNDIVASGNITTENGDISGKNIAATNNISTTETIQGKNITATNNISATGAMTTESTLTAAGKITGQAGLEIVGDAIVSNNLSANSGNINDLTVNNILVNGEWQNNDEVFNITDSDGNIITSVDKDGLHTTNLYVRPTQESTEENILDIIDAQNTSLTQKIETVNTNLTEDINEINTNLTQNINKVNTDLTQNINKVNADLTQNINKINTDLTQNISQVNTNLTQKIEAAEKNLSDYKTEISNEVISKKATINGDISATGDISAQDLTLSGTSLSIANGIITSKDINNTNKISTKDLEVTNNVTVTNNISAKKVSTNEIEVSGNTSITGSISGDNITVKNLTVQKGEDAASGNAIIEKNLTVNGNETIQGNLTATTENYGVIKANKFISNGDIEATGNVSMNNLSTASDSSIGNNLTVNKDIIIKGSLQNNDKVFNIVDNNGNIVAKIDAEGLNTIALKLKDVDILKIIGTEIANVIDTAPETLNTLNELAAALGDDPNFATTVSNRIGTVEDNKLDKTTFNTHINGPFATLEDNFNKYKDALATEIVSNKATINGNISGVNIDSTGNITATTSGKGTITGNEIVSKGNVSATGTISGENASFTGGVTAGGDIKGKTIEATNGSIVASGTIKGAKVESTGDISIGGNAAVTGNVSTTNGTVSAKNINASESVLTKDLTATGAIISGNISTNNGNIVATNGNITASNGTVTSKNIVATENASAPSATINNLTIKKTKTDGSDGNLIVENNLTVKNAATFEEDIITNKNVDIAGTLDVTGTISGSSASIINKLTAGSLETNDLIYNKDEFTFVDNKGNKVATINELGINTIDILIKDKSLVKDFNDYKSSLATSIETQKLVIKKDSNEITLEDGKITTTGAIDGNSLKVTNAIEGKSLNIEESINGNTLKIETITSDQDSIIINKPISTSSINAANKITGNGLEISGETTVGELEANSIKTNGAIEANSATITGNTSIGGTLEVADTSTFKDTATFEKGVEISGDAIISGNVSGATINTNNLTVSKTEDNENGNLSVDGNITTINGNIASKTLNIEEKIAVGSNDDVVIEDGTISSKSMITDNISVDEIKNSEKIWNITDNSGNILATFEEDGLKVYDVYVKEGKDLISLLTKINNYITANENEFKTKTFEAENVEITTKATINAAEIENNLDVTKGNINVLKGNINVSEGAINGVTLNSEGAITAAGKISTTNGDISTDKGNISTTDGNISASGSITGGSIVSNGDINTQTGTISGAILNSSGNITAESGIVKAKSITTNSTNPADGNIEAKNAVKGATIESTGDISAGGNISTANGTVSGASLTASGAISGASLTASGNIESTAGNVKGLNIEATSGNITANGDISTSTGTISGASLNSSGSVTAIGDIEGKNLKAVKKDSAGGDIAAEGNITTESGTIKGATIESTGNISANGVINNKNTKADGTIIETTIGDGIVTTGEVSGKNIRATNGISAQHTISNHFTREDGTVIATTIRDGISTNGDIAAGVLTVDLIHNVYPKADDSTVRTTIADGVSTEGWINCKGVSANETIGAKGDIIADTDGTPIYLSSVAATANAAYSKSVPYESYLDNGVDLNTVVKSGFYRLSSGHANNTNSSGYYPCDWCQMIVCHGGGDTITQIIVDYTTSTMFVRSGNPSNVGGIGVWTGWNKMVSTSNFSLSGTTLTITM